MNSACSHWNPLRATGRNRGSKISEFSGDALSHGKTCHSLKNRRGLEKWKSTLTLGYCDFIETKVEHHTTSTTICLNQFRSAFQIQFHFNSKQSTEVLFHLFECQCRAVRWIMDVWHQNDWCMTYALYGSFECLSWPKKKPKDCFERQLLIQYH